MNNIDNVKSQKTSTPEESAVRTWQDDLANQPEVEGIGPHGERSVSEEARVLDNMRARIG
ncbi:hypothetical protein AAIG33_24380 [Phytobacter ursingii]|uniref:hypothetical protein n=1 Tax=Phytobacter ursingii TaxID=1972431 RepID=UPI0031B77FFA